MPETDVRPKNITFDGEIPLSEWCEILNCEEHDLLKAMSIMGSSTQGVDDYLILNRQKKY